MRHSFDYQDYMKDAKIPFLYYSVHANTQNRVKSLQFLPRRVVFRLEGIIQFTATAPSLATVNKDVWFFSERLANMLVHNAFTGIVFDFWLS
jgi:hypothetical protein